MSNVLFYLSSKYHTNEFNQVSCATSFLYQVGTKLSAIFGYFRMYYYDFVTPSMKRTKFLVPYQYINR